MSSNLAGCASKKPRNRAVFLGFVGYRGGAPKRTETATNSPNFPGLDWGSGGKLGENVRSPFHPVMIMALEHGWPIVLDLLFSGYLSLAMDMVGPDHLSAMLKKAQKDVPRFAAVMRAQGAKPEGSA